MSDPDFAKGASQVSPVYDTSPSGLGLSPAYLAASSATAEAAASGGGGTGTGDGVPTGTILPYAGVTIPTHYVACNGTHYDGTDPTYTDLWIAIGTTYGGSGIGDFAVPDIRGRMIVGLGTNSAVSSPGNSDGQAVASRRPQHRTSDAKTASGTFTGNAGATGTESAFHQHGISDPGHVHGLDLNSGTSDGNFNIEVVRNQVLGRFVQGFDSSPMQAVGTGVTAGSQNALHFHGFTPSGSIAVSLGGSVGSGNANDALDAPSYIVIPYIIHL